VNCCECFAEAPPENRELDLRPPTLGPLVASFSLSSCSLVVYDGLLATLLSVEIVVLACSSTFVSASRSAISSVGECVSGCWRSPACTCS
jgi:hypothetical protein